MFTPAKAELPVRPHLPEISLPHFPKSWEETQFMLHVVKNFGVTATAQAMHRKHTQTETNEAAIVKHPPQLLHPLHLRRTFSDMFGYTEIYTDNAYALPAPAQQQVRSNSGVIVDLGAYNGDSAAYFASAFPAKRVIAVEPNVRNFALLQKNAQPYTGRLQPINAAIAPQHGRIGSILFDNKVNDMVYAFTSEQSDKDCPSADTITPGDILELAGEARVDILKVDIEGAEKNLMASSSVDRLLERTGVLLIEMHDRFIPGVTSAVEAATERNGLQRVAACDTDHTAVFVNTNNP